MLRDDFDLRLTNELIETYLKIAYGIKPGCWLDAEKGLLQENTLYPKLKQMIKMAILMMQKIFSMNMLIQLIRTY